MAVFTHISLTDAQEFCALYPQVKPPVTITPIETGTDNSNYKLTSQDQTPYILTIFEGRLDLAHLAPIFDFVALINEKVITAPKAYKDGKGEHLNIIKGKTAALVEFIQGASIETPTHQDAAQMGALLGKMHRATEGISSKLPSNPLSAGNCHHLYKQCSDLSDNFEPIVINAAFERVLSCQHNLPTGAIHADAFPDNLFFKEGIISGIIDFYFACHDSYLYDFMLTLNAWCFDDKGHPLGQNITAFIEGYLKHRALTSPEIKAIDDLGITAALRIFSTRLKNFQEDGVDILYKPKDPTPYLNIVKFYNNTGLKGFL